MHSPPVGTADDHAVVHQLHGARTLLVDEQGIGLRATWYHDHRLVNLSIWREDRCVETFRPSVDDAAGLIAFLAAGLADAATAALPAHPPARPRERRLRPAVNEVVGAVKGARRTLATWIDHTDWPSTPGSIAGARGGPPNCGCVLPGAGAVHPQNREDRRTVGAC